MQSQPQIQHVPLSPAKSITTRFLRKRLILAATGMSDTTIWRLVRDGKFPPPTKLGPNSVSWRESDYEEWAADPEGWAANNKDVKE